ncbi:MAG: GTPase HflX [Acidimicrobiia bacterium]|nr:GTPase HflX [Acidimicrobiia bacterium]
MSRSGRNTRRLTATEIDLTVTRQLALVVGTATNERSREECESSLEELVQLVDTAGADVVERVVQSRERPHPATYVGSGKAQEIKMLTQALDVDVVVFDDELAPNQQRNLEKILECDVVDRTALILDIFAQHATTQEGMVQVELAQLRYRMPRLSGRGLQLSQQGGGIGTRGPGETIHEVDRRRIRTRMAQLERELDRLARTRSTQRKARQRSRIPVVALVGYTNAGKSTLLNRITAADVYVENRLFSTLDPTTRKLSLPGGQMVLCSDTVGFLRRLPHQLVEAFRSTLEEVAAADLLIHVVDASASDAPAQIEAVHRVLKEIGADTVPELRVINKIDIANPDQIRQIQTFDSLCVSAYRDEGIEKFVSAIGDKLRSLGEILEYLVPYERGDVIASLHRDGEVLVEVHSDVGTRVRVRLDAAQHSRYSEFIADPAAS